MHGEFFVYMKNVILFGVGGKLEYEKQKNQSLFDSLNIIAISDNNRERWDTEYEGIKVINPNVIVKFDFDYIVVLSKYYSQIHSQLIELGIAKEKIIHWDEFILLGSHGLKKEFPAISANHFWGKVLMISTSLGINGGTFALVNAGVALSKRGYNVTICSPEADENIIKDINEKDLNIIIAPAIRYPNKEELNWILEFDYIVVNVFQMLRAAAIISAFKPLVWWIHESGEKYSDIYPTTRQINFDVELNKNNNILVCPVSKHAEEVFKHYYPNIETNILLLGIDDYFSETKKLKKQKIVFGIIADFVKIKNQILAAEVFKDYGEVAELWIIGDGSKDGDYYNQIKCYSNCYSNIIIEKAQSRDELNETYTDIDVILCPSLEETLSMTIIEGMMNKKLVITSDATGIADYIVDGENGFVFKSGDADSLREKIDIILGEKADLEKIRENARKTYLDNFTLEKVGERFEKMFEKMSYKGKE